MLAIVKASAGVINGENQRNKLGNLNPNKLNESTHTGKNRVIFSNKLLNQK